MRMAFEDPYKSVKTDKSKCNYSAKAQVRLSFDILHYSN
jgi:hypothetical protein